VTWKVFLLAWAVALPSICVAAHAQESHAAPSNVPHAFAVKRAVAGVPNFGEVTASLYRGGQPSDAGFESLAKMGVGIVIDFREGGRENEREQVTKRGMQYISIPWHCAHPDHQTVAKFLGALRENSGKKVFVHCHAGVDRTGVMIAAYRMNEQGWTNWEAFKEMEAFGFNFTHKLVCSRIASFEYNLPKALAGDPQFQNLRATPANPAPAAP
jgi:tyrosine-protein phosphatase SIW14